MSKVQNPVGTSIENRGLQPTVHVYKDTTWINEVKRMRGAGVESLTETSQTSTKSLNWEVRALSGHIIEQHEMLERVLNGQQSDIKLLLADNTTLQRKVDQLLADNRKLHEKVDTIVKKRVVSENKKLQRKAHPSVPDNKKLHEEVQSVLADNKKLHEEVQSLTVSVQNWTANLAHLTEDGLVDRVFGEIAKKVILFFSSYSGRTGIDV